MIRTIAIASTAMALAIAASDAQSAGTVRATMVIPEDKLPTQSESPCTGTPDRPITMRFTGMKIDNDGVLKLKRVIRIHPAAGDNPPINGGEILPQANLGEAIDTPLDMLVGDMSGNNYVIIKIAVKKRHGAGFIRDPDDQSFAYIRAGRGKGSSFCGLTKVDSSSPNFETITFGILPNQTAGFAVGILVPEVDEDGDPTGRFLPIIIDPNVKNRG